MSPFSEAGVGQGIPNAILAPPPSRLKIENFLTHVNHFRHHQKGQRRFAPT